MRDHHQLKTDDFLADLEKEDPPLRSKKDITQPDSKETKSKKQTNRKLTQGQKFFLSVLFFLLILLFGFFIMLITGTMVLP